MPYHPLADILDTYQSLSPFMQFAWLVVPPVFIVMMLRLWLGYRLALTTHANASRLHLPRESIPEEMRHLTGGSDIQNTEIKKMMVERRV